MAGRSLKLLLKALLMGMAIGVLIQGTALGQARVETWTEFAGPLALGYPVPEPMDSVLPVDGFREYESLHARHQQLMFESPWVQGTVVGTTFAGGRDIWAYELSDDDIFMPDGQSEAAVMANGGIHAREWQSPEVVTGLMERFAENADDASFHQYLLEHMNIVLIPVNNVDGFLQTQRFPSSNWLGTDPEFPDTSPRDGRMRRKNMRLVDEQIGTRQDHLLGIDLNRNNPPFWNSGSGSSALVQSLVYHGIAAFSEPEADALTAAAALAPPERLRMYMDVHSFSKVFFSIRTQNGRRNAIQTQMLAGFTSYHRFLPGNQFYSDRPNSPLGGLGLTAEYFGHTYQIPSLTLEIEPGGLLAGAEYGGLGTNGHDGFVLPDAEIRRVRENLAETLVFVYYYMAGAPAVREVQVVDASNRATVIRARWKFFASGERQLETTVLEPLREGVDYLLWVAFDKPMRLRKEGTIVNASGQGVQLAPDIALEGAQFLALNTRVENWRGDPGGAPDGYLQYRDDALRVGFTLPAVKGVGGDSLTLAVTAADMANLANDGNPATPVDWSSGHWTGLDGDGGVEGDVGGTDRTIQLATTSGTPNPPFLTDVRVSGSWFDPTHEGEGFLIEVLNDQTVLVYWFTYDSDGNQRWYTGIGRVDGNRIHVDTLFVTRGGQFGPDFDPATVVREEAGWLSLLLLDCANLQADYIIDGRLASQELRRITTIQGLGCDEAAKQTLAGRTGSWFDPAHDGEGFLVEMLDEDSALVYWFSYDEAGNQAWFFGVGRIEDKSIVVDEMLTSRGGQFGPDFDPASVELVPWGQLTLFLECETGSVSYVSDLPNFGSGEQSLVRITSLADQICQ